MIKYRTCNICEALCGIVVEVEDNQVVSIKGDKDDPLSNGHICPKAYALKDVHEDPDRLKFPLRKTNGEWEQISWEEAFAFAAKGIVDIQSKYGEEALGIYQGNPTVHNLGSMLYSPPFVKSLKTKNRFTATSVDQLPQQLAAEMMFGNHFLVPIPDLNRTDFWIILGGNPVVSNGSLMTAPDVAGKIKNIQERGGKVVVIDPRRTRTARKASQHLFIRPGTDVYLLLSMLHQVLFEEKVDTEAVEHLLKAGQVEGIKAAVESFTPALAAKLTRIPEEEIRALTQAFLQAERAVCYGRLGVSITEHGSLCHWAINTLNILTGNFDVEGGAMFASSAVSMARNKSHQKRFGRWTSRVSGLPEFAGELPMAAFAEEILTPGEGQIKGLITSCGNPVLSSANGKQIDQALDSLDFMMSIDIYLNESTRHADLILPPATGLETIHYGLVFHNFAIHNSAKYSEPSVEKDKGTKYDWEIFLGLKEAVAEERAQRAGEHYEAPADFGLDAALGFLLKTGPKKMSLEELKAAPSGLDFGPLETNVAQKKLMNIDGQIDLFPSIYQVGLKEISLQEMDPAQLLMIGRRSLRGMNSWLHNSYRMVKGKEFCTAQIHPKDAAHRSISNGETIEVFTAIGTIQIQAEITDEVGLGTISIPHGWGHTREGVRLSVASVHHGVNCNDIADAKRTDTISANAALNGIPVGVRRVG